MESWGIGPFENDHAVALVERLLDQPAPSRVQWRFEDALSAPFGGGEPRHPPSWPPLTVDVGATAYACVALQAARDAPSLLDGLEGRGPSAASVHELVAMAVFDRTKEQRELLSSAVLDRLASPADNDWFDHWRSHDLLLPVLDQVDDLRGQFASSHVEWQAGLPAAPLPDARAIEAADPYDVVHDESVFDWWAEAPDVPSIRDHVVAAFDAAHGSGSISDQICALAMAVIVATRLDGDTGNLEPDELELLAPLRADPVLVDLARRAVAGTTELTSPAVWAGTDDLASMQKLVQVLSHRLATDPPAPPVRTPT